MPETGTLWGTDDVPTLEKWNASKGDLLNPACPDETPTFHVMPDGTTVRYACMSSGVVYTPPFTAAGLAEFNWPALWDAITPG